MIHKNPMTNFSSKSVLPDISPDAFIHPMAAVIGNVTINKDVFVAPFASVRGDEGQPLYIGASSNIQDGVIIHALETEKDGSFIETNTITIENNHYAVYIAEQVSLAHQSQIHGPAMVNRNTFIGMKSLVFKSIIGSNCVVEPGSIIMNVTIADGRYVPAGSTITEQIDADMLPLIDNNYYLKNINKDVTGVNIELAQKYKNLDI